MQHQILIKDHISFLDDEFAAKHALYPIMTHAVLD